MADQMRAYAQQRVTSFGSPYRPVEKGVSGRERTFQQNRNFGPGAFKPYHDEPSTIRSSGSGVYRGGSRPRPIPNVRPVERTNYGRVQPAGAQRN